MKQKANRKQPKTKSTEQAKKPLSLFVPAISLGMLAALAVISGISSHGWTYDELIYAKYGLKSAQWLTGLIPSIFNGTFGTHLSAATINEAWYAKIDMQPPFAQVLSGLSASLLSTTLGDVTATRLPAPLLFGVAVASLFWLTANIAGKRAAWFAACALLLLPRFFGDAHLISLDMPVSALVILTAAVFYAATQRGLLTAQTPDAQTPDGQAPAGQALTGQAWKLAIISGVIMGLGILTKLNAAFLIGGIFVWCAVFHRDMLSKAAVAFLVVSPLVFLLGWPWLWHNTLGNLAQYFAFHFRHYSVLTYYLGQNYPYAPWHYPFVMTAVTVPALVLVLSLLGLGLIIYPKRSRQAHHPNDAGRLVPRSLGVGGWLLIFGAIVYLLPSAMPFSPKYDGVRLFDPFFPFLLGLAGIGFGWLTGWIGVKAEQIRSLAEVSQMQGKLAAVLGIGLLLPSFMGLVKITPYELAYYNAFVGGPAGARARGFETIYWGGVCLDSLKLLKAIEKPSPRVLVTPQGVVSLFQAYQNHGELRKDIQWVTPPPPDNQTPDWPQQRLREVDLVMFQCAQAEFDVLAWKLYREGKPEPSSVYLNGVPLLLVYRGDEARRLFPEAAKQR